MNLFSSGRNPHLEYWRTIGMAQNRKVEMEFRDNDEKVTRMERTSVKNSPRGVEIVFKKKWIQVDKEPFYVQDYETSVRLVVL